jgi:DNA (cytosine-5)-methyltransferase 1
MQKLKYIDLFAGCGGLSLGFQQSEKWSGLFAVEKSPDAFGTLRHNLIEKSKHFLWPEWLPVGNYDINDILQNYYKQLIELRGKVKLVVGGPPCQGFSLAGRRNENDQRNNLVHCYLDFIEATQPDMILLENVKGFKIGFKKGNKEHGTPYSEIVLEKLKNLGYRSSDARVLNFSRFGVPQHRKRCIIFGIREGTASCFFDHLDNKADEMLRKIGLERVQTLENAISDLVKSNGTIPCNDSQSAKFRSGLYSTQPRCAYQEYLREGQPVIPDSHRFPNHSTETELKFKTIIRHRLNSSDVRRLFFTRKCSTRLLRPDEPTPTLTTLPDDYVHYSEPRILTVREYARIQSFPDWYEILGKYTTGGKRRIIEVPRYSQIGNAIPPLFGRIVAETLSELAQGDLFSNK